MSQIRLVYISKQINTNTMGGLSGHMSHIHEAMVCTVHDVENIIDGILVSREIEMTEKIDGYNIHVGYDFEKQEMRFFRNSKDILLSGGMSTSDMKDRWKDRPKTLKVYLSAADILKKYIEDHSAYFLSAQAKCIVTLNVECVYKTTNIIPYTEVGVYLHNIWSWDRVTGKCESTTDIPDGMKLDIDKYEGIHLCPVVKLSTRFTKNEYISIANAYKNELEQIIFDEVGGLYAKDITLRGVYYRSFTNICLKKYEWITNIPESVFYEIFNRIFFDSKHIHLDVLTKYFPGNEKKFKDWLKTDGPKLKKLCMHKLKSLFTRFSNFILANSIGYVNYENRYIISDLLYRTYKQKIESLKNCDDLKKQEIIDQNIDIIESTGEQINALEGVVIEYNNNTYKLTGSFAPLNQLMWL